MNVTSVPDDFGAHILVNVVEKLSVNKNVVVRVFVHCLVLIHGNMQPDNVRLDSIHIKLYMKNGVLNMA